MLKFALLLAVSALFAALGYLLNSKNAQYYLSGYWNLKKEDKEKVDLINFLKFFKRFHLGLAVSILSVGIVGGLLLSDLTILLILMALILLAYVFMAVYSSRYWKDLKHK